MIISETPYRHVVQTEIKPFRGLLLGFFFITVGMSLDIGVLVQEWVQILLVLALLLAVKTVLVYLAARALKAPLRSAIQLGFLLSQGSEFAFVIFSMAALQSALGSDVAALLITAVAASLALTPALTALGYRMATRIADRDFAAQQAADGVEAQQVAPVVIFGMDEVGRRVADGLEAHGLSYMALEMDHDRFVKANADGYPVAFGDLSDLRLMETMQMSQRPTVVVTIRRYEISRDLTPILRERYPQLTRFISVENDAERKQYEALGMQAIVTRSIPAGLDLAAAVLRVHGVDDHRIRAWMRRQQEQLLDTLELTEAANEAA
jgi:CPA2 family monovalent cation:H+ antiporter-2